MLKSSSGRPKKKLEITVVEARPMSQSGFVDQHSAQKHGEANEWSLTYGKLHPSQSADNLMNEKESLMGFAYDAVRKNSGTVAAGKRPTIIRPSRSNDNLKSPAHRVDRNSAFPSCDLWNSENVYGSLSDTITSSTLPRGQPGAIINPGFRLESDKRIAAPAPPRARKKVPPPRPPPMRATQPARDPLARSRFTTGEDDLINFDPLAPSFDPSKGKSSANRGSIMSELEEIFMSQPQPRPNPTEPPPKPLRANSRNSRPTSLVRPILTVPHCVAQYDFEAEEDADLPFNVGDTIRLIEQRDDQWFYGCNLRTQKEGLFPSTFVEVKVPLVTVPNAPEPIQQPKPKPRASSLTTLNISEPPTSAAPPPPTSTKPHWPPSSEPPAPPASTKPHWPPSSEPPAPPASSAKPRWPPSSDAPPHPVSSKPRWPPSSEAPPPAVSAKPHWPPTSSAAPSDAPPSTASLWPPPSEPPPPPPVSQKPTIIRGSTNELPVAPKPKRSAPVATVNPEPAQGKVATLRKSMVWPPARTPSPPVSPPPPVVSKPKPAEKARVPQCRAVYAYDSGVAGDLQFDSGDVIYLLGRVGDDWLKGELKGKVGIFPKTFVNVEVDLPSEEIETAPAPKIESKPSVLFEVKAIYQYDGPKGDLSFKAGETIKVTKLVSNDWMEGFIDGRQGVFPVNFVEKPEPPKTSPPPPPPPKQLPKARAIYSFQAQTADDLTFQENDIIMLKEEIDADWLRGEINGCVGIFPKSFVTILVPL